MITRHRELAPGLWLLTTSRLRTYQTCARKHEYRYWLRRSPVNDDSEARFFGNLWHAGRETYWEALLDGAEPSEAQAAAAWKVRSVDADPHLTARCLALLAGYHLRWLSETARWRIVAVEAPFEIPLVNPATGAHSRKWKLGGKIDLIIEILDGPFAGYWVVEHKSTTKDISPGSTYWQRLRLDQQITLYIDGARSLGHPVQGVIYDAVRRPTHEPLLATPEELRQYTQPKPARPGKPCKLCKAAALGMAKERGEKLLVKDIPNTVGCDECTLPKPAEPSRLYANQRERDESPEEHFRRVGAAIAEDPDAYFQRSDPPVVRLEDELFELRQSIWQTAHGMNDEHRKGHHPMNPSACESWNSLCPYFAACTRDARIEDDTLYRRREHVHPELADGPNQEEDHDSDSQEEAA